MAADEARRVAWRVLAEPPRWCAAPYAYRGTLALSAGATIVAHALTRWTAKRRGWWSADLDADSRIVSTLNAVAMLAFYRPRGLLRADSYELILGTSCDRDLCLTALVGYLFVDGCLAARELLRTKATTRGRPGSYADPLVFAHHVLVALAFSVGLATRLATAVMAALIVNELSTPFVNLRVLLNLRWPPPRPPRIDRLYLANGLALLATYTTARVGWTLLVLLKAARAWRDLGHVGWILGGYRLATVAVLSLFLLGHFIINLCWFAQILKHVRRLFEPPTSRGKRAR